MRFDLHFALAEFLHSDEAQARGITNYPTWAVVEELKRLAYTMEGVREICGSEPVLISSGYRCPELNAVVGGVENSAHLYGAACDFTIPMFGGVSYVCLQLEPHLIELEIDQLILEMGWVHIGRAPLGQGAPRYQCLTIDNSGTHAGFGE